MDPHISDIDGRGGGWTATAPAWLLSLTTHLVLALFGVMVMRGVRSPSNSDEPVRPGEIVLVRRTASRAEYFADEQSASRHEVLRPVDRAAGETAGGAIASMDKPPLLAGIDLPLLASMVPVGGEGAVAAPQLGGPRSPVRLRGSQAAEDEILAADALIPREKVLTGPTAELSLFGSAAAIGRSFVFVIDRSSSMGGEGLGAIQAAAKELALHLDSLSSEQTFQLVAYNEAAAFLTGRELISATAENKKQLIAFVSNMAAYGQTEHTRGLLAALRMKPEVIFLLTDGGDPILNPGQLRLIREENGGRASIHCVQFGRGPQPSGRSFLARLAAENGGSYVYIDVNAR